MTAPVPFALTVLGEQRSVFVVFGAEATDKPPTPAIQHGDRWLPVLSVQDLYGEERRDDLDAAALRELQAQLAGAHL